MEIFLAGLAAIWKALGWILVGFISLWLASKPVGWLRSRPVALDDETRKALQEIDAQRRESEHLMAPGNKKGT